ncbi:MAG: hypothetical protein KDI15_03980 [Thiothrix sp.]|nr:hypothetical protein [Thiothrix sp.]HPE59500.1 hypothetical protein [Thiolinea sp.]
MSAVLPKLLLVVGFPALGGYRAAIQGSWAISTASGYRSGRRYHGESELENTDMPGGNPRERREYSGGFSFFVVFPDFHAAAIKRIYCMDTTGEGGYCHRRQKNDCFLSLSPSLLAQTSGSRQLSKPDCPSGTAIRLN